MGSHEKAPNPEGLLTLLFGSFEISPGHGNNARVIALWKIKSVKLFYICLAFFLIDSLCLDLTRFRTLRRQKRTLFVDCVMAGARHTGQLHLPSHASEFITPVHTAPLTHLTQKQKASTNLGYYTVCVTHPGRHWPHWASLVGEHAALSRRFSKLHLVQRMQGATPVSVLNFPSSHRMQTPAPPSPKPQSWEGFTIWTWKPSETGKLQIAKLGENGAVSVMWYVSYLGELFPWATCRTCNASAIGVEELCLITAELRCHQHTASLRKKYKFKWKKHVIYNSLKSE